MLSWYTRFMKPSAGTGKGRSLTAKGVEWLSAYDESTFKTVQHEQKESVNAAISS